MRKFRKNTHGVSNIIGYMFSFAVASMVMVSAVFITIGIVDDKTSQVARIEAQNIANYVANTVAEMVAMKEANPNAEYSKTMDIPLDLAGKSYYIEVTEDRIYVNTTDGHVTASCSTYHADELNIGASGRINGGGGQATLSSFSGDYVYKLDFGTGNNLSHSPVESGYYRVGATETIDEVWPSALPDALKDSPYRVPIKLYNPTSESLVETPIKIVLNTSNFDYDNAIVVPSSVWGAAIPQDKDSISSANVISNLHFYDSDPANEIAVSVNIDENNWYPHWYWVTDEVVRVSIDPTYPDQMPPSYIDGNTLKLGTADCKSYSILGDDCVAVFDRSEAFQALSIPPETIDEGIYTPTIKGKFLDGTEFNELISINLIYGEKYVDDDFDASTTGWQTTHFDSIQDGINAAITYDTIYVYEGTYNERITFNNDPNINLTGQDRDLVVIDGIGSSVCGTVVTVDSNSDGVKITSFRIKNGGASTLSNFIANGAGVLLDGCTNVQISNCISYHNCGDNYRLENGANNNIIINCKGNNSLGIDPDGYGGEGRWKGDGIEIDDSDYNRVINCQFYDNDNEQGNGVRIDYGAHDNRVEGCNISNNNAQGSDGILIANSENSGQSTRDNVVADCKIYGHNGIGGDGIAIFAADYVTYSRWPRDNKITNCTIYNNYGGLNGGVIFWRTFRSSINNSDIYSNEANIWMRETENCIVDNCNLYDAKDVGSDWIEEGEGIHLDGYVNDTKITNCNIWGNEYHGIIIQDRMTASPKYKANNHTIQNCNIWGNGAAGVILYKTSNNLVDNCSIHDNYGDGLRISGRNVWGEDRSIGNTVQYCNFYNNEESGVTFWLSGPPKTSVVHNRIKYNNFYNNGEKGVWIKGSTCRLNHIYGNNFIENDNGNENARDDTIHCGDFRNKWDNGGETGGSATIGNYWDDIDDRLDQPCSGPTGAAYQIPGDTCYPYDNEPRGPATICDYWDDENATMFSIPNVIYAYLITETGISPPVKWNEICNNITRAIDHATPGGTVYIKHTAGTAIYDEPTIIVNKSVRIIGLPGVTGPKPMIKNSGGGPVFNVTNMSFDSDFLYSNPDKTIYFDSLNISEGSSGIYISEDYNCRLGGPMGSCISPIGNKRYINISNCDIHDNINGISLHENYVNVTNCNIIGNEAAGINLSDSDLNNIVGCTISNNGEDGINIADSSSSNEIKNCDITGHSKGIHIIDSDNNDIDWCTIEDNGNGTYIESDSDSNNIRNCDIEYNTYGIYLTGSTSTNNNIYHNNFDNTNNANSDSSPNTWDNGVDEGNYWSDYVGLDEDLNGIGDTPYDIPGGNNQDNYPLGASWRLLAEVRDYSVDYWNPYGESVILLNLNMDAYEEKIIYLYYGNSTVLQLHKFSDTAVFFDDFNNLLKWSYPGAEPPPYCHDGVVTINNSDYMITLTSSFAIPEPGSPDIIENAATANGTLYVIEARTKLSTIIQETQGNLILLNQNPNDINNCYLVSNHVVPGSNNSLKLYKRNLPGTWYKLNNTPLPSLLDHWQRMIAYVYVGKHTYNVGGDINGTNATKLSVGLYDFTSYNEEGNVSDTDGWIGGASSGDPPGENDGAPYLSGKIGLGCGLNDSSAGSSFIVDWIRVRKAPVVQPTVSIGAPEGKNYGWMTPSVVTPQNSLSNDPYKPGPLLRDFHECDQINNFLINGLPIGTYTITIVSGDNDASCSAMDITFNDQNSSTLQFDAADAGEFNTKSITIVKDTEEGTALSMTFDKPSGGPSDARPWAVNAITIERGKKGVKLS